MAKGRTFDSEVLHAHYSANSCLNLDWLEKPSRHQFRWRCTLNRWHTAKRQIRSGEVLAKVTQKNTPRDMYVSTSAWLNPVNLPKIKDTKEPHPILLDHLIVFDIDIPPFSRKNMERARKAAVNLLDFIEGNKDFIRVHLVFSGSKGFHLIFREKDRTLFSIEDPTKREHAVREARKELLKEVVDAGHPVDKGITADTRRIIRLPGSIHGSTGWECTIISEDLLRTPFKKWRASIPRHAKAIAMPRWGKSPEKKKVKGKPKSKEVRHALEPSAYRSLELSTHVPGTKNRSAIIGWLPKSWGSIEKTVKIAMAHVEKHTIGPACFWTEKGAVLMMLPRAFPRPQAAKICRKIGLERTALSIESGDHHWVRISPRQWEDTDWDEDIQPLGVLGLERMNECSAPWSVAHLEMAKRLELPVDPDHDSLSGTNTPAIRVVDRK
jgi:hypothetical protein